MADRSIFPFLQAAQTALEVLTSLNNSDCFCSGLSKWWSVTVFLAAIGLGARMIWQALKHSLGMR